MIRLQRRSPQNRHERREILVEDLGDGSVLKELDFSAFHEGVSGVPQSFYDFFDIIKFENKKSQYFQGVHLMQKRYGLDHPHQ